ncbi:hypothetical protein T492DRAFT_1013156 [Pavlovales sp. CCMP2436]|nr:hypothetical protein T492DRAFT_1013156 [Pavlovales sp. CCMP2436]
MLPVAGRRRSARGSSPRRAYWRICCRYSWRTCCRYSWQPCCRYSWAVTARFTAARSLTVL